MERHHRGVLKDINGQLNMNPSQIRDVNLVKRKSENRARHDCRSLLLHEDSSSSDDYRSAEEEEDETFNLELDLVIKGINSVHILTPTARKLKTQLQRSYSLNKTIDLNLSQQLVKELEMANENRNNEQLVSENKNNENVKQLDSRNDEVFASILNESANRLSSDSSICTIIAENDDHFMSIVNQPGDLPVDTAIKLTECFTKTDVQVVTKVIQQNMESNNIHNSTMLDTKTTNVAEALSTYMLPDHDMFSSENKSLDLSNINKSVYHDECENVETNNTMPLRVPEVPCVLEDTLTEIKESPIKLGDLKTIDVQINSVQQINLQMNQFCEEKSGKIQINDNIATEALHISKEDNLQINQICEEKSGGIKDIQINDNIPTGVLNISKGLLINKEDNSQIDQISEEKSGNIKDVQNNDNILTEVLNISKVLLTNIEDNLQINQICEEKSGDTKDIQINDNIEVLNISKELLTNKEDNLLKHKFDHEELCGTQDLIKSRQQYMVNMNQMFLENEKKFESVLHCPGDTLFFKDCIKPPEISLNVDNFLTDNEKLTDTDAEKSTEINTNSDSDLNNTVVVNLVQDKNSVNIDGVATLNDIIDTSCKTIDVSENSFHFINDDKRPTDIDNEKSTEINTNSSSDLNNTIVINSVQDENSINNDAIATLNDIIDTSCKIIDVVSENSLDENESLQNNTIVEYIPCDKTTNLDATTTITKDVIDFTLDEPTKPSKINFNLNETITLDSNTSEESEPIQQSINLDSTIIINDNKTSPNDFMKEQCILNSPDIISAQKKFNFGCELDTTLTLNESNSANDYIASIQDKKHDILKKAPMFDAFGSPLINPHNFENDRTADKPDLNLAKELNLANTLKFHNEQIDGKSSDVEDRNKFNLSKNSLKMFEDFESTRIRSNEDTIFEMNFPDEFDWHNDFKKTTENKFQMTKTVTDECTDQHQKTDRLINFDISNTNNPDIVISCDANNSLNSTNIITGPNLLNDVPTEVIPIMKNSKEHSVIKDRSASPKSSSSIFKWIGQFLSPNKSLLSNDENLDNNEKLLDRENTINDTIDHTRNSNSISRGDGDFVKLIDETPFSEFMSVSTTSEPFNESRANNEEQFDYLNELAQLRQLVAQNSDKLKGVRLQIDSYHNKANELEHSIQMHERKLVEKEERERIIGITVNNFEKRVKELTDEYESAKKANESELKVCQEERDKAQDHLSSVESAFSDLHKKYEQCKGVIERLKTNQEVRKSTNSNLREVAMEQKTLMGMLEEHAAGQIKTAVADFESNKHQHKVEMVKWTALIKKAELRKASLQEALTKKQDENRELIELCDGLIQKVG